MSKKAKEDFKKAQERFERFIEKENNQLAVFNALRNVASETLPNVDVTNPNALLNVANDPQVNLPTRTLFLALLAFFILILFAFAEDDDDDEES
ncbi:hypothetical protein [Peribacillus asahii]|uniref:Uncharacterized protein n=1 Tax=Peribacillus asahii TaxID=228899 RepID=A0A3T0KXW4_9BACI|nr:hypothetical protein [Peribacillus asahii]AZV45190.1 hypothetical protein BAOM_4611 [Peribacillus asahii]USK84794.1 hypothetical protein LIT35_20790 [Peribacillus asahii]